MSEASRSTGLPLAFVEKDYWVTEVLRAVAAPIQDGHVVFKGGTSLSKAYSLIKRFSEDVDVLVVPAAGSSQAQRDSIMKGICERVRSHLGLDAERCSVGRRSRGQHREMRFSPVLIYEPEAVAAGTLLQLDVRGGDEPHEEMSLRSYVAERALASGVAHDEFDEIRPVEIRVLRPERTLVEKLYAVHDFSTGFPATRDQLIGGARHYYDIGMLLQRKQVISSLRSDELDMAELVKQIREVSARYGGGTPLPDGGFARSLAFDRTAPSFPELERAYSRVSDLVVGDLVPIGDVLSLVHDHADLLDPLD